MTTTPPWSPVGWESDKGTPQRCDVAIVGGGLAGLTTALDLAQAGVDVVVFEAREDLGEGAVGRGNGLVQLGLCEHPIQLVGAIGHDDAAELLAYSQQSIEMIDSEDVWFSQGGLWCASMDREDEGIARSTRWLQQVGLDCSGLEGRALHQRLGQSGFATGRFHAEEGSVNPRCLLEGIAQRSRTAGAKIFLDHAVRSVDETPDGLCVSGADWTCHADMVVYSAGWRSVDVDGWYADKLFPVRAQHLWESTSSGMEMSGRTQHGYTAWGPTLEGRVVSGCRWGSPHMEVGESTDRLNDRISAHLARFVGRFGEQVDVARREWTSIMTFTCDALPILGPFPGQPRKISCLGFNGQDLAFAMAAARSVATGILEGTGHAIPTRLQSHRFL